MKHKYVNPKYFSDNSSIFELNYSILLHKLVVYLWITKSYYLQVVNIFERKRFESTHKSKPIRLGECH